LVWLNINGKVFKDGREGAVSKIFVLKSLSYFENAEHEPMPVMLKSVSWEEVKKKIAAASNLILK